MGDVVSLTIQLSTAPADSDADDAVGGAMSRESFSRHSSRAACASKEQARSFSIESPALCASVPWLATPKATDRQIAADFIFSLAACAPGAPAIPAPPESA